jgi:hypothetical protein
MHTLDKRPCRKGFPDAGCLGLKYNVLPDSVFADVSVQSDSPVSRDAAEIERTIAIDRRRIRQRHLD